MYYIVLLGLIMVVCFAVCIGNIVSLAKKKQPYNGRAWATVANIRFGSVSTGQGVRAKTLILTYSYSVNGEKYTCDEELANRRNINVVGCNVREAGMRLGLPIGSQIPIQYLESNPAKSCFDTAWVRTRKTSGCVMGIVLGAVFGFICLCYEAYLIFCEVII